MSGCVQEETFIKETEESNKESQIKVQEEQQKENIPAAGVGLGNLCSGEDECISFCQNNRGQCEDYCKRNNENELCKKVFPQEGSDNNAGAQEKSQENEFDYFADIASLPPCGDIKEIFTITPLELSDFTDITPLGLLSPTAHVFPSPHLYFNVRRANPNDYNSLPFKVPITAPSDLTITTLKFVEAKGRPDISDSAILFGVCREFKAYFDHVKTFAPKIQEAHDKAPNNFCTEYTLSYPQGDIDFKVCEKTVNIQVKKGEQMGTAGGVQGQVFDFGAHDKRAAPKQFANPKRWVGRYREYQVCPLDYYSEPLKSQLKERLGGPGQKGPVRNAACGDVIQDIIGTAMGAWIEPGHDVVSHDPPHLALVHDYIEQQYLVFSMGDSAEKAGLPHGKYTFLPKNEGLINRHFKDIKSDGKVYCFETEDNYQPNNVRPRVNILISMPTPEKLQIQKLDSSSCGSGPWLMTNYAEFAR